MDKDLYKILGVGQKASDGEIRKAFLKLAKKYHPDVKPGNKEAEQRFKEVNLAYEVLKDKKKRAQYDQMRAMGQNPFAGMGAGRGPGGMGGMGGEFYGDFGLGDLFEEIFGGGFGGARGGGGGARYRSQPFARRGADQEAKLNISFIEAARGGERSIGLADGRRVSVKIPEGVSSGSKIKLRNQGAPGQGGGPNGDLILVLEVSAHPFFRREGANIVLNLPVSFAEAVLGAEIEVPTLDGTVHMKIPSGLSGGQRLKLRGKGIRGPKGAAPGDQFVEISIKVPKPLDKAHKEAARATRVHFI